jgi:hypothetical protein
VYKLLKSFYVQIYVAAEQKMEKKEKMNTETIIRVETG